LGVAGKTPDRPAKTKGWGRLNHPLASPLAQRCRAADRINLVLVHDKIACVAKREAHFQASHEPVQVFELPL
jgi:hypothetical protein